MPFKNKILADSEVSDFKTAAKKLKEYLVSLNIKSILLGLSGGADSVLLYHLLRETSAEIPGFRLGVSHANFNLRGIESKRDEDFLRKLILDYPLRCQADYYFKTFETSDYSQRNGISIEMAARKLRYDWWDQLLVENNYQRIATAHHADDNVETMLLNMLRGCGTRGIKAMVPDNGRIIRPLIDMPKLKVMKLIEERGVEFIVDSSNLSSDFRRNYLRNEIIPLIEKRWPQARKTLARTIDIIADENSVIEESINKIILAHPSSLPISVIRSFPAPLSLLHRWIEYHGGNSSIGAEINSIISSGDLHGQRWMPFDEKNCGLILTENELRLELSSAEMKNTFAIRRISPLSEDDWKRIRTATPHEVYLPSVSNNFSGTYFWRKHRTGDRISLFTETGSSSNSKKKTKLVSDVLRESNIPLSDRNHIEILCYRPTDEIVWIPGIRRSGKFLIPPGSTEAWHLSKKVENQGLQLS